MSFQMEPLPRIACFHGGGSTASIFSVQCEQLITQLSSTFEFVFFDAPFHRDAGPGVLPFFTYETYGPYRTWFTKKDDGEENADGRDEEGRGEGGVERVLRLIAEQPEGGEWIGVMGFSQGTRVVGGLLMDQQRRREMGLPLAEGEIDFKFGILCMGSFAPMVSDVMNVAMQDALITTPTLHLHGQKDQMYEYGKKQMNTYYDPRTTAVLDINYHHAMPWHRADLLKFVDMIRKLYRDSQILS